MVQHLATSPILRGVGDLTRIGRYLTVHTWPAGTTIVREGDRGRAMYFVLAGEARIEHGLLEVGRATVGDHFGELALLAGRKRKASVVALTDLEAARLDGERFDALCKEDPDTALLLLRRLITSVGSWLSDMTESVGLLLQERSMPRRTSVTVTIEGASRSVQLGTPVGQLLPVQQRGHLVVAALVDRRPVSLGEMLSSDCVLAPLTTASSEGRRVYHDSVGLLLLEAAGLCAPELDVRLDHGIGFGRRVSFAPRDDVDAAALAAGLETTMHGLIERDAELREEHWTVDEARSHFRAAGRRDAAELLATWRAATVPLVSYGRTYALRFGPLLPSTGQLSGFRVVVDDGGLLLILGDHVQSATEPPDGTAEAAAVAASAHTRSMTRAHKRWLGALRAATVGELNKTAVRGHAAELIRVAEGFQEKRVGQIADAITHGGAGNGGIRIVCIAGPSSSGKTTFMKRLRVQLQVAGIRPVQLSLDDYYVPRMLTPKDANGELDYESFEALRHDLLRDHLGRLLAGETIHSARYDFLSGESHEAGGHELALTARSVLLLEGIHGLNPGLVAGLPTDRVFRVFVCPLAQLPFDALTRVRASDLRLLRRIVRDRRWRGATAADNIHRWPSVRRGERQHIFPYQQHADEVFDSSLIYEIAVLKVYAERYLLEVPPDDPAYTTAFRLLGMLDRFVTLYPDQVPATSLLREFIGGSAFDA